MATYIILGAIAVAMLILAALAVLVFWLLKKVWNELFD